MRVCVYVCLKTILHRKQISSCGDGERRERSGGV